MVFDIETDGLYDEATKVYCMSYTHDGKDIKTVISSNTILEKLNEAETLIGHNIITYDLLVLKKLFNFVPKVLTIDTLALSWYLTPNRNKHGLEDYGVEFGYPKVKVSGEEWAKGDMGLMIERCKRDVEINWKLWVKQKKVLGELYK